MKISLITPAKKQSRAGNRTTAVRWARIFQELGHCVRVAVDYDHQPADLMVALHAWRSAESIVAFRERYPDRPLIVALTGTDIYRFLVSHPETTLRSMEIADVLVCLHDLVSQDIPQRFGGKLEVIYQSALPLSRARRPSRRNFDICVIGHLRDEKDSLRTALAVRDLPASSRIRVIHLGKAHNADWAERAREEMTLNPRYFWRGEVPGWAVRREFVKTRLMVLSSVMEGGANVVSEAVVAGVPVVASDIPGSIGLLGEDYPGYYPVGDTAALTELLSRAETDGGFLARLTRACHDRAALFTPERERESWRSLLSRFA
ncbi:MAG: TIGR04348 family glycosyltransferase [Chromatiaceae bacterium]|nr:TIGR04348 family glycosyltransferase [Chromatiaceae bacterium]